MHFGMKQKLWGGGMEWNYLIRKPWSCYVQQGPALDTWVINGMKNMTVVEEKSPTNQGLASTDQILFKSWQQRGCDRRRKVNTLEQDTILFIRLTWKISVLMHFWLAAAWG